MSSRRPDERHSGGAYRTHHARRSSVDSSGSPVDGNGAHNLYTNRTRAPGLYLPNGQEYPASPAAASSFTLHPAPYPSSHGHSQHQHRSQMYPPSFADYQGPIHNGRPVVPSQPYSVAPDMHPGSPGAYYSQSAYPVGQLGQHALSNTQSQVQSVPASASMTPPIVCEQCRTTFTRRHDLQRHMSSHHGDASFNCPYCTKVYARADSRKRHVDSPCPHAPKKNDRDGPSSSPGSSAVRV